MGGNYLCAMCPTVCLCVKDVSDMMPLLPMLTPPLACWPVCCCSATAVSGTPCWLSFVCCWCMACCTLLALTTSRVSSSCWTWLSRRQHSWSSWAGRAADSSPWPSRIQTAAAAHAGSPAAAAEAAWTAAPVMTEAAMPAAAWPAWPVWPVAALAAAGGLQDGQQLLISHVVMRLVPCCVSFGVGAHQAACVSMCSLSSGPCCPLHPWQW